MKEAFLLFEVDHATYAVPSGMVQFVELVDKITWVPNAPEFVEGVVSLRGQVLPVISVRKRFHIQPAPIDPRTRLLVIRLQERLIGMMVDSAREFAWIDLDQMLPPPETITGRIVEYLQGILNHRDRLVLIVNLERLFSEPEQSAVAGMPATAETAPPSTAPPTRKKPSREK